MQLKLNLRRPFPVIQAEVPGQAVLQSAVSAKIYSLVTTAYEASYIVSAGDTEIKKCI